MSPGVVSAVPLMRPLTPASVGPSMRQVEHQLMDADLQLETYQSGLAARCGGGGVFERLFYHSGMTLMFRFELLQATVNAMDSSVLKPTATTGEYALQTDSPSHQVLLCSVQLCRPGVIVLPVSIAGREPHVIVVHPL